MNNNNRNMRRGNQQQHYSAQKNDNRGNQGQRQRGGIHQKMRRTQELITPDPSLGRRQQDMNKSIEQRLVKPQQNRLNSVQKGQPQ